MAIMAHPKRRQLVPPLLEKLDAEAQVVWDRKNNRWDTGRRSLLAYDPEATHHLVLQDDALICGSLVAGLAEGADQIPETSPMCLYIGRMLRRPVYRAVKPGVSWLKMSHVHWGVGILIPTVHIKEVVKFGDSLNHVGNYDIRIGRWMAKHNIPVFYPWPSLVEHKGVPSLVPGRVAGRHALQFIGEHVSALKFPWSGEAVEIHHQEPKRRMPHRPTTGTDHEYLSRTVAKDQKLKPPLKFISPKQPQYTVPMFGVKFRDGEFIAQTDRQVRHLLSGQARRLGIRLVENS